MIESIKIINWQCHKVKVIRFEQITSIIGKTESGKSSILRALHWCCQNQPSNTTYISWGKDCCTVHLKVDKRMVSRRRSKKSNLYRLDKKTFKAFGTGVPEEITNLLSMTDLNFQGQLDAHFWFSETAGKVSKELNTIVNLGVIDGILSESASQLRKTKTELEVCEERLEDARKVKKELSWVPDFIKKVEALKEKEARIVKIRARIAQGRSFVSEWERLEGIIKIAQTRDLTTLFNLKKSIEVLVERIRSMKALDKEAVSWHQRKKKAEIALTQIQEELKTETKGRCPVCGGNLKL